MAFRFAHPLFGGLFFLLPFLVVLWVRGQSTRRYYFSSLIPLHHTVPPSWRMRLRFLDLLLWVAGLSLCILGLMRPQWGYHYTENKQEGIAIMLAVDTSRSMAALDFEIKGEQTDRLTVVKRVLQDFIHKRTYDEMGMTVFGELAFTQSPLTTDHDMLETLLNRLELGMAGDGTAVGDGLAVAVKRLKNNPAKSKIVVLLTDGASNAGRLDPLQAAVLARDLGIKVYTIGVGSTGKVPFPDETPWGTRIVMAELEIDEETLQKIAETTGGHYWNAKNTTELATIYATIDQLEKAEIKVKEFSEYNELVAYVVIPGLGLLLLCPFVRVGVLKRWI